MKRSQFYAAAADRYADELESADLTAAIDSFARAVSADDSTRFAVTAGRHLPEDDGEW